MSLAIEKALGVFEAISCRLIVLCLFVVVTRQSRYVAVSEMSVVGEISAIVSLVSFISDLSVSFISIAGRYKHASRDIKTFGRDIETWGKILDQVHRICSRSDPVSDAAIVSMTGSIMGDCCTLFTQIDAFRETLGKYNEDRSFQIITLLGRTLWIFKPKKLEDFITRARDMNVKLLLVMTIQSTHGASIRYSNHSRTWLREVDP